MVERMGKRLKSLLTNSGWKMREGQDSKRHRITKGLHLPPLGSRDLHLLQLKIQK